MTIKTKQVNRVFQHDLITLLKNLFHFNVNNSIKWYLTKYSREINVQVSKLICNPMNYLESRSRLKQLLHFANITYVSIKRCIVFKKKLLFAYL